MDWEAAAVRRHADDPAKAHGRIEARRIAVRDLLPDTLAPFPEARRAFRVVRERTNAKTGETSTETAYGVTSADATRAGPGRLLAWNRGHWQVENGNHWRRDATMGEDDARFRAGHAPDTPRPTTPCPTTSSSPSSSTTASATCPRPTDTT